MEQISIRLFGVFRDLDSRSSVNIETALPLKVSELKEKLAHEWSGTTAVDVRALLNSSALATERKVLGDADVIDTAGSLALLPPVCGG